jgi:hypothetical protein
VVAAVQNAEQIGLRKNEFPIGRGGDEIIAWVVLFSLRCRQLRETDGFILRSGLGLLALGLHGLGRRHVLFHGPAHARFVKGDEKQVFWLALFRPSPRRGNCPQQRHRCSCC